jgi:hypothetical protein
MKKLPALFALFCSLATATASDDWSAPHGGPGEAHPATRQYAPDRNAGFLHCNSDSGGRLRNPS